MVYRVCRGLCWAPLIALALGACQRAERVPGRPAPLDGAVAAAQGASLGAASGEDAASGAVSGAVSGAHTMAGDPGWRPVDETLPRVTFGGGVWRLEGEGVDDVSALAGRKLLLQAKMVLDDSVPQRRGFWVTPNHDGCVDRHEAQHRGHWIRVEVVDGPAVRVTDQLLLLEGTFADSDGRTRLEATRVWPLGMPVRPSDAR